MHALTADMKSPMLPVERFIWSEPNLTTIRWCEAIERDLKLCSCFIRFLSNRTMPLYCL